MRGGYRWLCPRRLFGVDVDIVDLSRPFVDTLLPALVVGFSLSARQARRRGRGSKRALCSLLALTRLPRGCASVRASRGIRHFRGRKARLHRGGGAQRRVLHGAGSTGGLAGGVVRAKRRQRRRACHWRGWHGRRAVLRRGDGRRTRRGAWGGAGEYWLLRRGRHVRGERGGLHGRVHRAGAGRCRGTRRRREYGPPRWRRLNEWGREGCGERVVRAGKRLGSEGIPPVSADVLGRSLRGCGVVRRSGDGYFVRERVRRGKTIFIGKRSRLFEFCPCNSRRSRASVEERSPRGRHSGDLPPPACSKTLASVAPETLFPLRELKAFSSSGGFSPCHLSTVRDSLLIDGHSEKIVCKKLMTE